MDDIETKLEKELFEALKLLKQEIDLLVAENKDLIMENENLQEENDSLWSLMEEMKESDIKNWGHLMKQIKSDIVTKSLMTTKKVAKA